MKTLVFVEHHEGKLQKDSLGVLGKAAALGGEVEAVLLGDGVEDLAAEAGKYGASRVHVADDVLLAAPLPQPRVDALESLVSDGGHDTVLFAASVLSADVAAGSGRAPRHRAQLGPHRPRRGERAARRQAPRPRRLGLRGRGVDLRAAPGADPLRHLRARRDGRRRRSREVRAEAPGLLPRRAHGRAGARGERRPVDRGRRRDRRRRPRSRRPGELRARRGAREGARRRGRRDARGGRRGLVSRTRRRSARPARPSHRSSTWRSGSPARSSTRSGCRARA